MKKHFLFKTILSGLLENNKGIHLVNRKIRLNYLTEKDKEAIKIAKKNNIKNFALSFTKSLDDVKKRYDILYDTYSIFIFFSYVMKNSLR